jgi:S-(hydroxymethyl)glutathione dehydrogenase/alcohol dehydrogenase
VVIEDLRAPDVGPYDVRVRVDASGVCHTDLTILKGGMPLPPPCILGHEGAGTVLEVGDAVSRVKLGDRIVSSFSSACGDCWYCLRPVAPLRAR